jgi:hypothetical protein
MTVKTQLVRFLLLVEAACFAVASLIHSGRLIQGYQHPEARIAESVIAIVLLVGLVLTWIVPARVRAVGLAGQGFALLGTLIGIFTIATGVGPGTAPDIVYHVAIVLLLVWGLKVTAQLPSARGVPD